MHFGCPQAVCPNRSRTIFQSVVPLFVCCGTTLALLLALVGLLGMPLHVAAKPLAQVSPLSPLPTAAPASSAAGGIGESALNGEGTVGAAAEHAQPESPLPTAVITPGVTAPEVLTPTATVRAEELPPDASEESRGEIPVEALPTATSESTLPATPAPTSTFALSLPPVALAEPANLTELLQTGQVSLVLVGALFVGLLTTIGLVLTRK